MSEDRSSILDEPTNEYAMRHAANELNRMTSKFDIPAEDQDRLNFAYQQLQRGANTLSDMERDLRDAKRMVALLVIKAGGEVSVSDRALLGLSNETIIETMDNVIEGGMVLRVRTPV